MQPESCPETPAQLARFPEEAREAYRRYRTEHDRDAAQRVVLAAVVYFLPAGAPIKDAAALADDLRLIEDLGYDSLAIAEIVFFLEDLFGVVIKTADLVHVKTVGDLRTFVDGKLEGPRAGA
ncbi:hypothetical protein ASA1KI_43320 [Opitutales bacterium ASA1]|uniref:acyl carrier protein n=1 Tax=Congregicoccus parvus TaxID=3081749 RepID=UPI002B2C42EF|nr:hypothetical protein ASA1KI_43320 [Opitutales bacterium ASA1]